MISDSIISLKKTVCLLSCLIALTGCASKELPLTTSQPDKPSLLAAYDKSNNPKNNIHQPQTFNYVYIGDRETSVAEAKSKCVKRANKKARTFSAETNVKIEVLKEEVEYIENIVTVECRVQVVNI